jgi:hypothetical protein
MVQNQKGAKKGAGSILGTPQYFLILKAIVENAILFCGQDSSCANVLLNIK